MRILLKRTFFCGRDSEDPRQLWTVARISGGATDFISKPPEPAYRPPAVRRPIRSIRDRQSFVDDSALACKVLISPVSSHTP